MLLLHPSRDYTPTVVIPIDQLKVCTTLHPRVGCKQHPHGKREKQPQRDHLLALGCKARNWGSHDLTELCGVVVGDTKRSGVFEGIGSARL